MGIRDQSKKMYHRVPVYDKTVRARSIVFILALMFGTGGGFNSGAKAFKSVGDDLAEVDPSNIKGFFYDCPECWVNLFRELLF
jgi:hypothetical protein